MLNWTDQVSGDNLFAGTVGLLVARPAADPSNAGTYYLATDSLGTLYKSDGVAWAALSTLVSWVQFLNVTTAEMYVYTGDRWMLGPKQQINATISAGDIEIGAVELKDGATDTRAKIGAGSGLVTGDNAVAVADPTVGLLIGPVTASPTANTVLDRLKALLTGIVLATGSAIIGRVSIDQTTPGTTDSVTVKTSGKSASVTLTRTNDVIAYTANDVIGAATGSTAALTFAVGPTAGGEIMITSVSLEIDIAAIPTGMTSFDLHLYNVTPPSALGDNAAFDLPSGDRASYLGKISLGAPVDLGSTLRIDTDVINKQITTLGANVFGYLVTSSAYTPAASVVKVIGLHAVTL